MQHPVVILDNGGGSIKAGVGGEAAPRKVFPNCSAKPKGEKQQFLGDQLLESKELSQLTLKRPIDRGYLVNFDLEREIWSRVFKNVLRANARDVGFMITEPLFNFPSIRAATEEIAFEEFGVASFYSAPASDFSIRRAAHLWPANPANQALCGVVVDAGFSFTHVVPYFEGRPLLEGVRRINVGGKALTNYIKQLVTYRSLDMSEETYLMEHIKDTLCFVSQDVRADLALAHKGVGGRLSIHRREYVLPDGVNNLRGYVKEPPPEAGPLGGPDAAVGVGAGGAGQPGPGARDGQPGGGDKAGAKPPDADAQVLVLNNERFLVPEVLFHPSDIGLKQAGVAETVVQAVKGTHTALHPLLYSNVVLTGGSTQCPGFKDRFVAELQPLVPDDYPLGVYEPPSPSLCAWEGMSLFVSSGAYASVAMTKRQYEETGGSSRYQR